MPSGGPRTAAIRRMPPGPAAAPAAAATNGSTGSPLTLLLLDLSLRTGCHMQATVAGGPNDGATQQPAERLSTPPSPFDPGVAGNEGVAPQGPAAQGTVGARHSVHQSLLRSPADWW